MKKTIAAICILLGSIQVIQSQVHSNKWTDSWIACDHPLGVELPQMNGGENSRNTGSSNTVNYTNPHSHSYLLGHAGKIKRWAAALTQFSVPSDAAFTTSAHGLAGFESDEHNRPAQSHHLGIIGGIYNDLCVQPSITTFTCKKTPFRPSLLVDAQLSGIVWNFSRLAGSILPGIDCTELAPKPTGIQLISGVRHYRYDAPVSCSFDNIGNFEISVTVAGPEIGGANNTKEIKIPVEVRRAPKPDFTFSNSLNKNIFNGCRLDTLYFKASYGDDGSGLIVDRYAWKFSADPTDIATVQEPKKMYAAEGVYAVALKVMTPEGCISDTVKDIHIFSPPVSEFLVNPSIVCEGAAPVIFTSSAIYAGAAPLLSWYYNIGDWKEINNISGDSQSLNDLPAGTYTIKHVVKVSDLCISDTTFKTLIVYDKPQPKFVIASTDICTGIPLKITDRSSIASLNGSTLASWSYDFGDGTPMSIVTTAPDTLTHTYAERNTTNNTISLKVLSDKGCGGSYERNITIHSLPLVDDTRPVANGLDTGCGEESFIKSAASGLDTSSFIRRWISRGAKNPTGQGAVGCLRPSGIYKVDITAIPKWDGTFRDGALLSGNYHYIKQLIKKQHYENIVP